MKITTTTSIVMTRLKYNYYAQFQQVPIRQRRIPSATCVIFYELATNQDWQDKIACASKRIRFARVNERASMAPIWLGPLDLT